MGSQKNSVKGLYFFTPGYSTFQEFFFFRGVSFYEHVAGFLKTQSERLCLLFIKQMPAHVRLDGKDLG